jgi:hypothetical protein
LKSDKILIERIYLDLAWLCSQIGWIEILTTGSADYAGAKRVRTADLYTAGIGTKCSVSGYPFSALNRFTIISVIMNFFSRLARPRKQAQTRPSVGVVIDYT